MSIIVSTAPVAEPVSVSEVKTRLGIDDHDRDSDIDQMIKAARRRVEKLLFSSLITQSLQVRTNGFPACFPLAYGPVQSVTSITYTDANGDSQTLASDQYTLDANSKPAIIEPAWQVTWPTTRDIRNSVVVEYVAGYGDTKASVPEPIRAAIIAMIDEMLCNGMMECTLNSVWGTLSDWQMPAAEALEFA